MQDKEKEKGRRVVRVEDLATTLKIKKVQAATDLQVQRAQADAEAQARKAEAEARKAEARMELKRMQLSMSAREAASRHLAHFAGLYMFLSVLAFLYAVSTLNESTIAVVAGLVTLVVTTVGGLLRSIVSEGKEEEPTAKDTKEESE